MPEAPQAVFDLFRIALNWAAYIAADCTCKCNWNGILTAISFSGYVRHDKKRLRQWWGVNVCSEALPVSAPCPRETDRGEAADYVTCLLAGFARHNCTESLPRWYQPSPRTNPERLLSWRAREGPIIVIYRRRTANTEAPILSSWINLNPSMLMSGSKYRSTHTPFQRLFIFNFFFVYRTADHDGPSGSEYNRIQE